MRDVNPGEAKMLAAGLGQQARMVRRPSVLAIEALDGGFIVSMTVPDYGPDERRVVPNADALVSVVQKWACEDAERRERGE